ncbi:dehydrodolichyl diphosphate synthase 6-like [Euphorbia lathyris]|uniref:dehydrodolichyl diphosphate synthase 6-like n=1 Tax=Euphorbia lathyris TaxID=212925 RepID=UPI0033139BA5
MEVRVGRTSVLFGLLVSFFRRCLFCILSRGPIPSHLAFIMDGNRRFAKKENLETGIGHRAGFTALMSVLKYCCELGVKHVTFYAFSIDNFKRRPDEVQILMDLMVEKAEGLMQQESIVNEYGIRVYFLGNLKLLSEPVQAAAEKVMKATAKNTKCMLLICVAYTSTDEIRRAVQESCKGKIEISNPEAELQGKRCRINLVDVEKHMYMAVAPDPDIMIRTSGETRLSNFLLWQSSYCQLYSPDALWPEIGIWELVWAILSFQRNRFYLDKKKKHF